MIRFPTVKRALYILSYCLTTAVSTFPQGAAIVDPVQGASSTAEVDYETAYLAKIASAIEVTEEIVLDGVLDEPAWARALPAKDFVQRSPFTGRPAVEPTEVRFLYDEDNLYVGVICFDSDVGELSINELARDFNINRSDSIQIAIDSLHDRRSAYSFRTNPGGALGDSQISNGSFHHDWDAVWDVRTSTRSDGWVAEFVIPFKTLRFATLPGQVWGLNIGRKLLRINEESFWSPYPIRYGMTRTSLFGTLNGLDDIEQGRNLKVTPFVTAGATRLRPAADPSGGFETDYDYDGGLDLKYSVTPSLTLDGTYRTDFAQVEVDQQQVNLTRFSLFFPEKRDFFLENEGTFSFGSSAGGSNLVPFFSRRIGLSPAGTPIPIVGGARMSGRIGRYDLGVLAMKTKRAGEIPSNNYVVGRVRGNFLTNSWIGALVTNRDSTLDGSYNRVFGADTHLEFYDRLRVDSFLLKSETPGLSDRDQARQLAVAWRDDELTASAGYNELQLNFNPEVGFIRRPNNTRYDGAFSWNPRIESEVFRNLVFGTRMEYYEGGETEQIETRTSGLNLGIRFENDGSVNFEMTDTFDRLLEPFDIRRDIAIPVGDYRYRGYSASASSNPGRRISGTVSFDWGEFWNGRQRSARGNLSLRPNYHLNIDIDYRRDHVDLPAGRFTTDLVGTRVAYAFTPRALLNGFFQYNSSTRQVSSNIRFNIIHRPLSDLFLVYNDLRDSSGRSLQRAFIVKVTNLFDF